MSELNQILIATFSSISITADSNRAFPIPFPNGLPVQKQVRETEDVRQESCDHYAHDKDPLLNGGVPLQKDEPRHRPAVVFLPFSCPQIQEIPGCDSADLCICVDVCRFAGLYRFAGPWNGGVGS